jgi:lactoylglutathione lyase
MHIEHVAIWARDLETLRAFYERHFGARSGPPYENRSKRFRSYFLSFASGARLELMHRPDVPHDGSDPGTQRTGLVHLAFVVGDEADVDTLTRRLADEGHRVIDGPRRTGDGYYESVVLDPEGNRVELAARRSE